MFVAPASDHLPGEPVRVRAATWPFLPRLVALSLLIAVLGLLLVWTLPLFAVGLLVWGWPPHQPRPSQLRRYLTYAATERPPPPGLAPLSRLWLVLRVLLSAVLVPAQGLAWFLDELLYGRALDSSPVRAPLIVLSAARSGSTQISRYLEDDPSLAAPSMLQSLVPYLWVWTLAELLGGWCPPELVRRFVDSRFPEEFQQRHEGDPFRTDTLEIFFFALRTNLFAPAFGPRAMLAEFAVVGSPSQGRQLWEADFVAWLDRLGRKTLLRAGPTSEGTPRRLFVKGHFLDAADTLAERYPDAHFLTVIRPVRGRLRSVVNHLHGNAFEETLGAIPWAWLAIFVAQVEAAYCEQELEWFTRSEGPARTVVPFSDYVEDLEGTMRRVYRECMNQPTLPDHVPVVHAPRERKHYRVARTLEQVGIDGDALAVRLAAYDRWCAGPADPGKLTSAPDA